MAKKKTEHYRVVRTFVHNDPRFRQLSGPATLLWHTLYTHPQTTGFGCMRCALPGLAAEMRVKMEPYIGMRKGIAEPIPGGYTEAFTKVADELSAAGELDYDNDAPLLVLPNWLRHNQPDNPKHLIGFFSGHQQIPVCDALVLHLQRFADYAEKRGGSFPDTLANTLADTFPEAIQQLSGNQDSGLRTQDSGIAAVGRAREGFLPSIRRAWLDVVNRPLATTDPDRIDRWQSDGVDLERAVFVIEWLGARATIAGETINSLAYFEPALKPGADPQPVPDEDTTGLLASTRENARKHLSGDLYEACALILEKRQTPAVLWGIWEGIQMLERKGER